MSLPSDAAEVTAFLKAIGLDDLRPVFAAHDIGDEVLLDLNDDDLREIGLNLGQRKRVLRALEELKGGSDAGRRDGPAPGGGLDVRRLSIVFCDLVGSTDLSERLIPDELYDLLQGYYRLTSRVMREFDGYISQLQGDGIVVLFGYPRVHGAEAERAIGAGLALLQALLAHEHRFPDGRTLRIAARLAVASGQVVVGRSRDGFLKEEIHSIGPVPNRAARLQAHAEPGWLVVDDPTREQAGEVFVYERLPDAALKGFGAPVGMSRVLTAERAPDRFSALRRSVSPLVGREKECAELLRKWEATRWGAPALAIVAGDAGLGKTRLVRELESAADAEGARVLRLACSPLYSNSPLHPVIELLRGPDAGGTSHGNCDRARDRLNVLSEAERALVAPLLGPGAGAGADGGGPEGRRRLLDALTRWLTAPGEEPGLVTVEDMHWADATTLDLLERCAGKLDEAGPTMLVVTTRDRTFGLWEGCDRVLRLALDPLDGPGAGRLLDTLLAGREVPDPLRREIVARSDGNPLMLEELMKSAGDLEDDAFVQQGGVPTSLYDSVAPRIDRLQRGLPVARAAAVFGRSIRAEALAVTAGLGRDELSAAIDHIREAGIFAPGLPGAEDEVQFRHALYREVVYERLIAAERSRLHSEAARVLSRIEPELRETNPEILAWHHFAAQEYRQAAPLALLAGERAAERSALTEASHHLEQSLKALDALPTSTETDALRLRAVTALAAVKRARLGIASPEAGALGERMLELARRLGDGRAELQALSGLYAYALVGADYRAAAGWADALLASARAAGDDTFEMIGLRATGAVALHTGAFGRARDLLSQALDRYDVERHLPLTHAQGYDHAEICHAFIAFSAWMAGDPVAARRASAASIEHTRRIGHANSLAQALAFRSMLGLIARDPDDLAESGTEAIEIGQRHGITVMATAGHFFRDATRFLASGGRLGDPASLLDWRERFLKVNPFNYGALVASAIGDALILSGDLTRARRELDAGRAMQERTGETWTACELTRVRARLLAAEGDAAAAEVLRLETLDQARRSGAAGIALRVALDLAEARPDEAALARVREAASQMTSLDDGWDARRLRAVLEG